MEKQEIFDRAVSHMRRQGRRAKLASGNCAYRGIDGTKCAVGALIPDELYCPDMEGKCAMILVDGFPDVRKAIFGSEDFDAGKTQLLTDLQGVHDSLLDTSPSLFAKSLERIAKALNLNPQVITAPLENLT